MKRILVVLLALVLMFTFASCGGSTSSTAAPATNDTASSESLASDESPSAESYKIGFVVNLLNHPSIVAIDQAAKAKAAEIGNVELTVVDPQGDSQKQIDMINQFTNQQYDAIIVVPIDVNSCLPAYKAAQEANVPILEVSAYSTGDTAEYVTCAVYGDQVQKGEAAANALITLAPEGGDVVIIQGLLGSSGQIGIDEGFDKVMEDHPEFNVVARQSAEWQRDKAMLVMEDMLTKYDDFLLFVHDDSMSFGAIEAMRARGVSGVTMVTINTSHECFDAIRAGDLTATITQDAYWHGEVVLENAVKLAKGEEVPRVVNDPAEMVTIDNIDSYEAHY